MMKHIQFILALISSLIATLAVPAHALTVQRPHTAVSLVTEADSFVPGKPLTFALTLTPIKGWHTYWKNPGDSGAETALSWKLPPGFTAGDLAYPTPERIPFGTELLNYGYTDASTLLVEVNTPSAWAANQPAPLTVKASWLVCNDEQCVPENAEFALSLNPGNGTPAADRADVFMKARTALPKAVDWPTRFSLNSEHFALEVPWNADFGRLEEVAFFPLQDGALAYAATQDVTIAGGVLRLVTKAGYKADLKELDGVLKVKIAGAPKADAFLIHATQDKGMALTPIASRDRLGGSGPDGSGGGKPITLVAAIGFALLGGLLLNLMPCVFPILSLKALSIARSGNSQAHAQREALAYTAGTLATMAALGGVLLALRAGGEAVGWAFQLQDPRVVAVLSMLVFAIALNLAGVFEVRLSFAGQGQELTAKPGAAGAFWTGALAVLVATPCTAPFMGAALGATLALPPLQGFLIYLGLGLGMALPFLALGFIPSAQRLLPKPGAWMDSFRRFLAFPMFGTALWLLWVLGQQTGVNGMALGLALALALAFALWLVGRAQAAGRPMQWHVATISLATALGVGALLVQLGAMPATAGAAPLASDNPLQAEAFSDEQLDRLLAAKTPTFVYFTADWCVTCKVNERSTLVSQSVTEAFKAKGVKVLKGDWTRQDAKIAATLRRYGRDGVPLYLYFAPGATKDTPLIFPQILTPTTVLSSLG